MTWGHNFDWESYCIVGEIAGHFKNVYTRTHRYNYGPVFLCIQGFLYNLACIKGSYNEMMYRVLMVSALSAADLGIMIIMAKRYSIRAALIFFLNPISIIITGFHNQFDNIAILLALCTLFFYNEEEKFNRRDIGFVLLFALCLMTKHILFLVPIFLLMNPRLCFKKKIMYACVPVGIFLMSFVPFLTCVEALQGILNHVFLYRSSNNFPLLHIVLEAIAVPKSWWFIIYIIFMLMTAFMIRDYTYERQLLIYLIAMVTFSSAIANQYLVIPMVAVCVFDVKWLRYGYMIVNMLYLAIDYNGFALNEYLSKILPMPVGRLVKALNDYGYDAAAWILFAILVFVLWKKIDIPFASEYSKEKDTEAKVLL